MAETENFLVPTATYLKSGIHIGTKFKTKHMSKFIYKTRNDGLSVLNLQKIDERLRQAIELLGQYDPSEILIVSRRENGWKPLRMLSKYTGIKVVVGRYPPGMMTNVYLDTFIEPKIVVVTDAWPDRNVVKDAHQVGVPVIALCDTNNQANLIDFVIPCNNKGKKSLGLLFYLLTVGYMRKRGMLKEGEEFEGTSDDFTQK